MKRKSDSVPDEQERNWEKCAQQICSALKASDVNLISTLSEFLELSKNAEHGANFVSAFCSQSENGEELVQWLTKTDSFFERNCVIESLHCVLASESTQFPTRVARSILSDDATRGAVLKQCAVHKPPVFAVRAFELLVACMRICAHAPAFQFGHHAFQKVLLPTCPGEVRCASLRFLAALMRASGNEGAAALVHLEGQYFAKIFGLLPPPATDGMSEAVDDFLEAVKATIAENGDVPKTMKNKFFGFNVLRQLVGLLRTPESEPEGYEQIMQASFGLLKSLCTSRNTGLCFWDEKFGLGDRNRNPKATAVLNALFQLDECNEFVTQLVAAVLSACPDQYVVLLRDGDGISGHRLKEDLTLVKLADAFKSPLDPKLVDRVSKIDDEQVKMDFLVHVCGFPYVSEAFKPLSAVANVDSVARRLKLWLPVLDRMDLVRDHLGPGDQAGFQLKTREFLWSRAQLRALWSGLARFIEEDARNIEGGLVALKGFISLFRRFLILDESYAVAIEFQKVLAQLDVNIATVEPKKWNNLKLEILDVLCECSPDLASLTRANKDHPVSIMQQLLTGSKDNARYEQLLLKCLARSPYLDSRDRELHIWLGVAHELQALPILHEFLSQAICNPQAYVDLAMQGSEQSFESVLAKFGRFDIDQILDTDFDLVPSEKPDAAFPLSLLVCVACCRCTADYQAYILEVFKLLSHVYGSFEPLLKCLNACEEPVAGSLAEDLADFENQKKLARGLIGGSNRELKHRAVTAAESGLQSQCSILLTPILGTLIRKLSANDPDVDTELQVLTKFFEVLKDRDLANSYMPSLLELTVLKEKFLVSEVGSQFDAFVFLCLKKLAEFNLPCGDEILSDWACDFFESKMSAALSKNLKNYLTFFWPQATIQQQIACLLLSTETQLGKKKCTSIVCFVLEHLDLAKMSVDDLGVLQRKLPVTICESALYTSAKLDQSALKQREAVADLLVKLPILTQGKCWTDVFTEKHMATGFGDPVFHAVLQHNSIVRENFQSWLATKTKIDWIDILSLPEFLRDVPHLERKNAKELLKWAGEYCLMHANNAHVINNALFHLMTFVNQGSLTIGQFMSVFWKADFLQKMSSMNTEGSKTALVSLTTSTVGMLLKVKNPEVDMVKEFLDGFLIIASHFMQFEDQSSPEEDELFETVTRFLRDLTMENNMMAWTDQFADFCCQKLLKLRFGVVSSMLLLETFVEKFSAGGDFNAVQLVQLVFAHSGFGDMMESVENQAEKALASRLSIFRLLDTVAQKYPGAFSEAHIPVFLSAYHATLSRTDQTILPILQILETNHGFAKYLPLSWGQFGLLRYTELRSMGMALWTRPTSNEILGSLDAEQVWRSALRFPSDLELHSTKEYEVGDHSFGDLAGCLDPRFFMPVLVSLLSSDSIVNCQLFVHKQCLGYALACLSSRCSDMRGLGYLALHRFMSQMSGTGFREKLTVKLWLTKLRYSLESPNVRLPCIVAIFLGKAVHLCLNSGASNPPVYATLSKFLLVKPTLDLEEIPEFYRLFNSGQMSHHAERAFLLEMLRDGLREAKDFRIAEKRYVFKLLLSFYLSDFADHSSRSLILEILQHAAHFSAIFILLCNQQNLCGWICLVLQLPDMTNDQILACCRILIKGIDRLFLSREHKEADLLPAPVMHNLVTTILRCLQSFGSDLVLFRELCTQLPQKFRPKLWSCMHSGHVKKVWELLKQAEKLEAQTVRTFLEEFMMFPSHGNGENRFLHEALSLICEKMLAFEPHQLWPLVTEHKARTLFSRMYLALMQKKSEVAIGGSRDIEFQEELKSFLLA